MKTYVKPELYYESFELSQHIAACALQIESADAASCKIINDREFGGELVGGFIAKPVCDFPYEQYCYTNGVGMPATFNS